MKRRLLPRLLAPAACAMVLALAVAPEPARAQKKPLIVVVLKAGTAKGPIAPYEEAAKGFRESLQPVAEVLITREISAEAAASVAERNPDLVVAFGNEAALFAAESFPNLPRVIALAPGIDAGAGTPGAPCAIISPDISAELQVRWIDQSLLDVRKVGVLYDPTASQTRIDELVAAAKARAGNGVEIVPLPVSSAGEVPAAFKKAVSSRPKAIDALLFIPDRTVITSGTISYLLKESLAQRIPAIGFNSYFVDNGAVLGFALDYGSIGRQAADAARSMPGRTENWVVAPKKVTILINKRVAEKLPTRTDYDPMSDDVREIR